MMRFEKIGLKCSSGQKYSVTPILIDFQLTW